MSQLLNRLFLSSGNLIFWLILFSVLTVSMAVAPWVAPGRWHGWLLWTTVGFGWLAALFIAGWPLPAVGLMCLELFAFWDMVEGRWFRRAD